MVKKQPVANERSLMLVIDMELLQDPFKTNLKRFLKKMEKIDPMECHETWRSQERQNWLQKNRPNSTWVKRSLHQDGLAADLHFTTYPSFPSTHYRTNDDVMLKIRYEEKVNGKSGLDRWERAAKYAKRYNIHCLGELFPRTGDWNHFQHDMVKDEDRPHILFRWFKYFSNKINN